MKYRISLVMIVKNEGSRLARCLESVKDIVDEMIIVDTGSTDNTKEIAKDFGASIYDFIWINDFSAARNYALDQATGDIRLILDADEYLISGTREDIIEAVKGNYIGQIMRLNDFKQGGEVKQLKEYISRICNEKTRYIGKIHEQLDARLPRRKAKIEIMHDGYMYIDKSERNLEILYAVIKENPNDSYMVYQLAHTLFLAGQKEESAKWYAQFMEISNKLEGYRCEAVVDYIYNLIAIGDMETGLQLVQNESTQYYDSPDFNMVCGEFYRELVLSDIEKYIGYLGYIEKSYIRCLEIGETKKYDSIIGTGTFLAAYNLGVWYEVSGQIGLAQKYYKMSMDWGYDKAGERLSILGKA